MKQMKTFLILLAATAAAAAVFFSLSDGNSAGIETQTPTSTAQPTPQQTATATATAEIPEIQVHYVSPDGSNDNPGTESEPWQSIQFAVNLAAPGQTIHVQPGTYLESVHITTAGKSGEPIQLLASDDGQVLIDGGENPAVIGEGDHWVMRGFDLLSQSDRTLRVGSSYWQILENDITGAVYFWGNHNLFEGNEVDGSRHTGNENGVMDDGPNSHHNVFRGNTVHDFELRGFWSQWLTHDNLFENNLIFNITGKTGMGIDLDAATNVGYRHTIRGNTIHDCAQTGIELENSYASVVENNLVYNTGLEGIQVINYKGCTAGGEENQFGDEGGNCEGDDLETIVRQNVIINGGRVGGIVSYHASGVKVYHNTVTGSAAGFFILGDSSLADNWDVRGNIFALNHRVQISVEDPDSFSVDQNNLIYQPDGSGAYEIRGASSAFYSLAAWQEAFQLGQNSLEGDPLFVDLEARDLHLQDGSPAIDAAMDLGIRADIENQPRPAGEAFDLGAYER